MPTGCAATAEYAPAAGPWRDWLAAAIAERAQVESERPSRTPPPGPVIRRAAAVLIGVTAAPAPAILLTERSRALTHHPGQISFPGGRIESADAGPAAAALREAKEEIGLAPADVELLGALPRYQTITGFDIRPFVGWVAAGAHTEPDPGEVHRLFTLPLAYALDPAHYRTEPRVHAGHRLRDYYYLDYRGDRVWGATAGILVSLARRVAAARGQPFAIAEPPDIDGR